MAVLKDKEAITHRWGEAFEGLVDHKRIHFTDDAIFIDLKAEVTNLDLEVSKQLRIVEPTAKDLRAMDSEKGDIAKLIAILRSVANVTEKTIEGLAASDFLLIQKVITGFLDDGL